MRLASVLLLAVGLILAVTFAGCGGCNRAENIGTSKEIASESMEKTGDTWHVKFQTKIDAPPDKVFEAFSQPERSHEFAPDNVMKSELVSQNGNTKVVDIVGKLDVLPPGFKVQDLRTEFTLYPDQKRITSKSIDFKLADIASEYKFEPADGGKATMVTFTQTSKDKGGLPVESLQKGALKETYVRQIQMVNKALGLSQPAAAPQAGG
jgi:ribosome-associated toxin RatA of RatAB toxin-antitoxin module